MSFLKSFKINNLTVDINNPPILVAEIGLNHNNNIEVGKRTIQAAKKAGAHAVKFQSYITEEFIDKNNSEAKFLFDIFKTYELSEKSHIEFQKVASDEGIVFFSTPLCNSSVDLLVNLKVPVIKIASGDIVNKQLLQKVSETGLPIFLSSGAADLFEIVRALEYLENNKVDKLCLMHCVSLYPTPPEKLNINTLKLFKEIFSGPIGFSDHSDGSIGAIMSVSYDACVIEKHFTLDKTLPGPDHTISADPAQMKEFAINIEAAFKMKGDARKITNSDEIKGRYYGRRSTYFQNGKLFPLRPALHTREENVIDSWEIEEAEKNIHILTEGVVKKFFRNE